MHQAFDAPKGAHTQGGAYSSLMRSKVWLISARKAGGRTGLAKKPQPRSAAVRRKEASRSAVTKMTGGFWPQRSHSWA